ncbi:MAG: hypothetical protein FWE62_02820 [Firmicutes bacterium]|nr:hypothetical protein [Bacillota bacterium]
MDSEDTDDCGAALEKGMQILMFEANKGDFEALFGAEGKIYTVCVKGGREKVTVIAPDGWH